MATGWEFQLLHGVYRPLGLGRYRMVVGIYLGGSSLMVYWITGRRRGSGPDFERNWRYWVEISDLTCVYRPLGFGRYRRSVGIYLGWSVLMVY